VWGNALSDFSILVEAVVGVAVGGNPWVGVAAGVSVGGDVGSQAVRITDSRKTMYLSICFIALLPLIHILP
jgi:hypothetical protein